MFSFSQNTQWLYYATLYIYAKCLHYLFGRAGNTLVKSADKLHFH